MGTRRGVRADEGFSLLELMAVLAIMGILIAVAVASFVMSVERSRAITCLQNQRLIDSALMQYQLDHDGAWPPADDMPGLQLVGQYVKWPGGVVYATCISSGAEYEYDHLTGIVRCPTPNHSR